MEIEDGYVKLESHQCPICGVIHQRDCGILMDKRDKEIKSNDPDGDTYITGQSLCEDHHKLYKQGYVALIVLIDGENSDRTGEMVHVKGELYYQMFNKDSSVAIPEICYIPPHIYNQIVSMAPKH